MSLRYKELAISFEDIDFEDDAEIPTEPCNIECYISITARGSNRLVDIITLDEQSNKTSITICSLEDMLQLIFKKKNSDEMIGSISIPFELFVLHQQQRFEQWITLFDDPDDDVFDGELGDNDGDIPKSLVNFELIVEDNEFKTQDLQASDRILPADILEQNPEGKSVVQEELPYLQNDNIEAYNNNIARLKGIMNELSPGVGDSKKRIGYQSSDNIILNNSFSFDQEQNPLFKDTGSGFNSLKKSFKEDSIYDEKRLNKFVGDEVPALNQGEPTKAATAVITKSPDEVIKLAQENEKKRVEAENQLFQQSNRMRMFDEMGNGVEVMDLRDKVRKYEEDIKQLSFEVKKLRDSSAIAEALKINLERKEGQYLDLLRLHHNNLETFEQRAKALNGEAAALKEKILDLEKEKLELHATFKVEKDNFMADFTAKNKETERERFRVEELSSTNATLEALIQDLKQHLDSTHHKLTEEIDKNTRLLHQNDGIVTSLKKVQEEFRNNQAAIQQQALKTEENLRTTRAKLKEKEELIDELNLKINIMTNELNLQKELNSSLEEELKLSSENLLCVNKEIEELKIEKSQEISSLNEGLVEVNSNFNSKTREVQSLRFELEALKQEKSRWEALDLYHQLINAEKRLEESENQRNWLQEQLGNLSGEFEKKTDSIFNELKQNMDDRYLKEIETLEKKIELGLAENIEKSKKVNELTLLLNEVKLKSFDYENRDSLIKELTKTLENIRSENIIINEEKEAIQGDLYKVTEELINQTNINIEQTKHINQLGMEAERLKNDLDLAIRFIPPVGAERSYRKSFVEEEDELDMNLNDFIAANDIPVSFSKLSPGEYRFGSKLEFLRLFTIEEVHKLKEMQAEERSRRELAELEKKEEKRAYVNVLAAAGKKKSTGVLPVENRGYRDSRENAKSPVTARQVKKDVPMSNKPGTSRKY